MQLYLNDQLVDLSDDSPVALTFQINNLAEVKNQQGNTSNQFKLPLTQRNRQILGYPDDIAFTTNLPYTRYDAKIVQDGMEIIPYGFAELNSVDDSTASITVLSGNVDFFDAIDGSIYDMGDSTTTQGAAKPWAPYDHAWTLNNVVNSQYKTEGWIWPVVDYGNLNYNEKQPAKVNINNLRPGFFLSTAIKLIAKNAGYSITGSLLNNDLYKKLIIQFSNDSFEHGVDYQNSYAGLNAHAESVQNQQIRRSDDPNDVKLQQVLSNGDGSFITARNAYAAKVNIEVDIKFEFDFDFFSTREHGDITLTLRLIDPANNNSVKDLASKTYNSSTYPRGRLGILSFGWKGHEATQVLSVTTTLKAGQSVRVSYDISDSDTYGTVLSGARFTVTEKKSNVQPGRTVQCEHILPDINQKDLLKDTLQRFGIICQADLLKKTINFASLRDIVDNIPNAKDWTSKYLDQGKSISFKLGSYAQANFLKYKDDDAIIPKTLGQAQIDIQDKTLPPSAELFESQFAASMNSRFINGNVTLIKKADDEGEFSISTQPRLLVDEKYKLSDGKTVTFEDGKGGSQVVNEILSVPYFYKPDGQYSLCWADMPGNGSSNIRGLKSIYYPELEHILKQTKKVVRWFMLTPRDILELDLLIPVYLQQDSAYYYVNKIDSWRKGQPTKVELVKLS